MLTARVQRLEAGAAHRPSGRSGVPVRRALLPVRASTEQATTEAPPAAQAEESVPAVDFTPSGAASTGYVEFDTAGQTNMYPVLTKAYEVPVGGDTSSATSATNDTALIAGGLALTLVAVALGALTTGSGSDVPTAQDLSSLSDYAARFAAEL